MIPVILENPQQMPDPTRRNYLRYGHTLANMLNEVKNPKDLSDFIKLAEERKIDRQVIGYLRLFEACLQQYDALGLRHEEDAREALLNTAIEEKPERPKNIV